MGQKVGMEREQVIACAEGREPALRDRAKDSISIGLECGGWATLAMCSLEIHA